MNARGVDFKSLHSDFGRFCNRNSGNLVLFIFNWRCKDNFTKNVIKFQISMEKKTKFSE